MTRSTTKAGVPTRGEEIKVLSPLSDWLVFTHVDMSRSIESSISDRCTQVSCAQVSAKRRRACGHPSWVVWLRIDSRHLASSTIRSSPQCGTLDYDTFFKKCSFFCLLNGLAWALYASYSDWKQSILHKIYIFIYFSFLLFSGFLRRVNPQSITRLIHQNKHIFFIPQRSFLLQVQTCFVARSGNWTERKVYSSRSDEGQVNVQYGIFLNSVTIRQTYYGNGMYCIRESIRSETVLSHIQWTMPSYFLSGILCAGLRVRTIVISLNPIIICSTVQASWTSTWPSMLSYRC